MSELARCGSPIAVHFGGGEKFSSAEERGTYLGGGSASMPPVRWEQWPLCLVIGGGECSGGVSPIGTQAGQPRFRPA